MALANDDLKLGRIQNIDELTNYDKELIGQLASDKKESVTKQIDEAVEKLSSKVPADTGYIAYFQSFTGTYSYLRFAVSRKIA